MIYVSFVCYLHSLSLAGAGWPFWCSSEVKVEGPY